MAFFPENVKMAPKDSKQTAAAFDPARKRPTTSAPGSKKPCKERCRFDNLQKIKNALFLFSLYEQFNTTPHFNFGVFFSGQRLQRREN